MKIEIQSQSGESFTLTVIYPRAQIPDDAKILEWLFREFNRVDGTELISILEVAMPSLSVGDTVTIGGARYRCEPLGWKPVT